MAAALRAHAVGLWYTEAAVELLIGHGVWLHRTGFLDRFVTVQAHRTGELAYSTVASSCVITGGVTTPGSTLSSVQVWRLVTGTPERLSLPVLAALCDIFACTPAELIATRAENATPRKAAASGVNVVDLATTVRPKRARIRPEQ